MSRLPSRALVTLVKSVITGAVSFVDSSVKQPCIKLSTEIMEAAGLIPFETVTVSRVDGSWELEMFVVPSSDAEIVLSNAISFLLPHDSDYDEITITAKLQLYHHDLSEFEHKLVVLSFENGLNRIVSTQTYRLSEF